ncbi:3-deoxy-D-manno-octulosonic acid transferase [Lascolabacillus massiliensis]|uniref:3-deoxy-D-manno-octulosonic acid transferase n=1 Tax=Lascolabacillus massiliensis TaxID=1627894 RepID=UPI0006B37A05|nr:glycosyltransferase N-terminal domain-containing protein [Lascolabacillus massiliensis]
MYNLGIYFMSLFIRLVSPFKRKARLMIDGHKSVFNLLEKEIDKKAKYIWFHVASLGEFEQARPIIEEIKNSKPEYKILLTFFSPSGYEVRYNYPLADIVTYLPFDTKKNARRFLELTNPHMVIFIKYEFWYNYINEIYQRRIPVYLVSAIFRKNQSFFKKLRSPYRNMLSLYTHFFVQDDESHKLLQKHGIKNVTVAGDTRIDRVIEIQKQTVNLPIVEKFIDKGSIIFIAGSSWPADEDIFINYFNSHPNLKLIIAPHEIDESHLTEIEKKLSRPSQRYSGLTDTDTVNADCMIIDCFGLLASVYRYADIGYIGGGFGDGIHNLPEAAVYGIPVIFGPNFIKFREAHDLIATGGGFTIKNRAEFNKLMESFINEPELREKAGKEAKNYIFSNSGATNTILNHIF